MAVVRPALAQTGCPSTVPWPLITMCADAPAQAVEVNANFATLARVVSQRTGNLDAGVNLPANVVGTTAIADNTVTSADLADGTIGEADLSAGLKCPDASRTTLGQCIFYRGGPVTPYAFNLRAAATTCRAEGAHLCSLASLQAAWAAGLEACAYGWLADGASPGTGTAGYPMQTVVSGCGGVGVNYSTAVAATNLYGAWCCK